MITDDDVMLLFEQADPARTADDHHAEPDAAGYLAALRQRSNNVTYIQPTEKPSTPPRRHRVAMIAAAAAVVLVIGALVLAARGDDEGQEVPATVPPTAPGTTISTTTTSPTSSPAADVDDPVGQAHALLTAIETGEPDEVQALLAPDYESRQWLGPIHQAASDAAYADPNCRISSEEPARVIVLCTTSIELAAHRLTNTLGAPVSFAITVDEAGITEMDTSVNNLGLLPFEGWKEANWRSDLPIEVDEITTVEDVVEYARVETQLAEEWVASALATVEGSFADFNAGDVDAFAARFVTVDRFAPGEVVAALIAEGRQYVVTECEAGGIEPAGLAVVCDGVEQHGSFDETAVEDGWGYRMVVELDGDIVVVANTIDARSMDDLNTAFDSWLLATHPDIHAQVTWLDFGSSRIPSANDQALVAPYYAEFVAQSDEYPVGG